MFNNGPRWSTSYKFINGSQHFPTRDRLKGRCWDLKASSLDVLVDFYKHFHKFADVTVPTVTLWPSTQSSFVRISISSVFRHAAEHPHAGPRTHKKMYFTAFQSWLTAGVDNVREEIPFLWFVGNISVLKFCGCPAEIGAKISWLTSDHSLIFLTINDRLRPERWKVRHEEERIEHLQLFLSTWNQKSVK